MELHERLAANGGAVVGAGPGDPFAEVKNRVHLAVIDELGPRLFNTDANPWPPGVNSKVNGWAGYACRADEELPDIEATEKVPKKMPRLADYRARAIFSDLTAQPARVDRRHRDGINALFGDGSASWVPRAAFDKPLAKCTSNDKNFNPQQDEIWKGIDKTYGGK